MSGERYPEELKHTEELLHDAKELADRYLTALREIRLRFELPDLFYTKGATEIIDIMVKNGISLTCNAEKQYPQCTCTIDGTSYCKAKGTGYCLAEEQKHKNCNDPICHECRHGH